MTSGAGSSAPRAERSPRRARIAVAAAALAAALFGANEVLVRILGGARVGPGDGGARYFAALGTHPSDVKEATTTPNAPARGFRFVGVGDSTVKGFPYAPGLSFVAFLALGLTEATGTPCDWEIVAKEGRSSAGVQANLEAALALRPDCLVFYFGHNEFAHRISQDSPFGFAPPPWPARLGFGFALLSRRLRDGAAQRRASELTGMPPRFPSELTHGARLLAFGDPQAHIENLPLDPAEVGFHFERFRANVRAVASAVASAGIPAVFVEPASSLLHAPLTSVARTGGPSAVDAWRRGVDKRSVEDLLGARELDAAPIRLTRVGLDVLRAGAAPLTTVAVEDAAALETRFVDLVHPEPELAAAIAERVAAALPAGVPRLDSSDAAAVGRFRAACERHLARADVRPLLENGTVLGRQLLAQMHLEYGNRAACEEDVRRIPEGERSFGMVLLLDLALRWRGASSEADGLLGRMAALHPEWEPSIAWWRECVRRAGR